MAATWPPHHLVCLGLGRVLDVSDVLVRHDYQIATDTDWWNPSAARASPRKFRWVPTFTVMMGSLPPSPDSRAAGAHGRRGPWAQRGGPTDPPGAGVALNTRLLPRSPDSRARRVRSTAEKIRSSNGHR